MHFGDVQKEFERISNLLHTGQAKLAASDYKSACLDLETCLAEMENAYPEDHPDRIICLKAVGDTYFALHRFDQARQVFKELLTIRDRKTQSANSINSVDDLIVRFKLAKSAERAGSAGEAMQLYESLTAMAEKSLGESHPFFSAILENRSALLWRSGLKKKSKELSEQARRNRNKYSKKDLIATDILSRLNTGGGELVSAKEALIYAEPGPTFNFQEGGKSRGSVGPAIPETKKILFLLGIGLLLLSTIAAYIFCHYKNPQAINLKSNSEVASTFKRAGKPFEKEIYTSLDGEETLELLNEAEAKLTVGNTEKSLKWAYAASVIALMHKNKWLVFRDSGSNWLTDNRGLRLYKAGSGEFKILKNMRAVAAAADKAYLLDGQYPEDLARLQTAGQGTFETNPVAPNSPPFNIVYIGHDRSWNPEVGEPEAMAKLCRTEPFSASDILSPGCVHAYYLLSGDAQRGLKVKSFFVRATDSSGHFLESGKPNNSLLLSRLNGRKIENFERPAPLRSNADEFLVVARSQSK